MRRTVSWAGRVWKFPSWEAMCLIVFAILLVLTAPTWILGDAFEGGIDAWIYHGYSLDPLSHYALFPTQYYGSRLGLILPNSFFQWLLPPVYAYAAHNSFWMAITLITIFLFVKNFSNQRTASVSIILLICNAHFLSDVARTYFPQSSLAYWAASVYSIQAGSINYSNLVKRIFWWTMAGVGIGGMLHSNLFGIAFLPATALIPFFICDDKNSLIVQTKRVIESWIFIILGVVLITFGFGLISHFLFGTSLSYYMISVQFILSSLGVENTYKLKGFEWVFTTQGVYFVLPLMSLIAISISIVGRKMAGNIFLSKGEKSLLILCLLNLSTMFVLELLGQPLFEYSFYAAYSIIPSLCGFAFAVYGISKENRSKFGVGFESIILSIFGFLLLSEDIGSQYTRHLTFSQILEISLILCLFSILFVRKNVAIRIVLFGIGAQFGFLCNMMKFENLVRISEKIDGIRLIAEGYSKITPSGPSEKQKLWYDSKDTGSKFFTSLTSTHLWSYSLISTSFDELKMSSEELASYNRVLILHSNPLDYSKAVEKMVEIGLSPIVNETKAFGEEGKGRFWITSVVPRKSSI